MKSIAWMFLLIALPTSAEVFKCVDGPSVVYQAIPCPQGENEKMLDITLHDPVSNAKALERLHEIEVEDQAIEERDAKAQKEKMDLLHKQLEIQNLDARLRYLQNQANTVNPPVIRPNPIWPGFYYGPVHRQLPRPQKQIVHPHEPHVEHDHSERKFGFGPRRN